MSDSLILDPSGASAEIRNRTTFNDNHIWNLDLSSPGELTIPFSTLDHYDLPDPGAPDPANLVSTAPPLFSPLDDYDLPDPGAPDPANLVSTAPHPFASQHVNGMTFQAPFSTASSSPVLDFLSEQWDFYTKWQWDSFTGWDTLEPLITYPTDNSSE